MPASKSDIIARLQKEILPLQGFRANNISYDIDIGPIKYAFPNNTFPVGAIHEFIFSRTENGASTAGFICGILSSLMINGGVCLWISSSPTIYPPALKFYGIDPDKIIFINLKKEKDVLWAMEESLKCEGLAGVIGEIREINFIASRRLQLAVEQSRVTGFLLRNNPINLITASIARWQISSLPSASADDLPGIVFPRWKVELLKARNGKPGSWEMEWATEKFRPFPVASSFALEEHKKTG